MPSKSRHSRESGNPPKVGPRFRGDDIVLVLDGKPVILIPALDGVENLALHRIGGNGGVLAKSHNHARPLRAVRVREAVMVGDQRGLALLARLEVASIRWP